MFKILAVCGDGRCNRQDGENCVTCPQVKIATFVLQNFKFSNYQISAFSKNHNLENFVFFQKLTLANRTVLILRVVCNLILLSTI